MSGSIRSRFGASVVLSIGRAGLNFFAGILVARSIGPVEYGNFMFLIGSFAAFKVLLNMSTSEAFYTFLSKKDQPLQFVLVYSGWVLFQCVVSVLIIMFILPAEIIDKIWLGLEMNLILIAFLATFLQTQVWQILVSIGESKRLTYRVQGMNLLIAATHCSLVFAALSSGFLSISVVFWLIIAEYLLVMFLSYRILHAGEYRLDESFSYKDMLGSYYKYCGPLVLYGVIGFLYEFSNRWILQHFGGAEQQGFYSVGSQFAAVSLLATTSMLRIFWKEIAEAKEKNDIERMGRIYHHVSIFLVMVGATISGFAIPWSGEIIQILLGPAYASGALPLAIMLLYPIHQSMGQIGGSMLLATEHTKISLMLGTITMVIGMPVTYFVLASPSADIPGLGGGAVGMSIKMVLLNVMSTNLMAWWICRTFKWKYRFMYQVLAIGTSLGVGYTCYVVVNYTPALETLHLYARIAVSGLLYSALMVGIIYRWPSLAALTKDEVNTYYGRALSLIRLRR